MPEAMIAEFIKEKQAKNEEPFLLNYAQFDEHRMPKFYATYEINKYLDELKAKEDLENFIEENHPKSKLKKNQLIRSFSFAKDDPELKQQVKTSIEELPDDKKIAFKRISLRQLKQFSRCKQM